MRTKRWVLRIDRRPAFSALDRARSIGPLWHHPDVGRLLLLFVVLPAVELALLIELGSRFGTLHTLILIVLTGVIGASLARGQGLGVMRQIQTEVAEGRVPADSLVDAAIILVAAALLVTPGVLTDGFGFLCLIPAFRGVVKRMLWSRLEDSVRQNRIHVDVVGGSPQRTVHDVRDVDEPVLRRPPDV
jgi:UPF0716 protein FxsA